MEKAGTYPLEEAGSRGMWRRLVRDEQGSLSPVFIMLLVSVVLLMSVFLDREWVNYTLQMIDETADFAAESAAKSHEVLVDMTVNREYYVWHVDRGCTPPDEDGRSTCWDNSRYLGPYASAKSITAVPERELIQNVNALFECGSPYNSSWSNLQYDCRTVRITRREVTFPKDPSNPAGPELAKRLARAVFDGNWESRPNAEAWIESIELEPRAVRIRVNVRLGSLFGLLWDRKLTQREGMAVVMPNELRFCKAGWSLYDCSRRPQP